MVESAHSLGVATLLFEVDHGRVWEAVLEAHRHNWQALDGVMITISRPGLPAAAARLVEFKVQSSKPNT